MNFLFTLKNRYKWIYERSYIWAADKDMKTDHRSYAAQLKQLSAEKEIKDKVHWLCDSAWQK